MEDYLLEPALKTLRHISGLPDGMISVVDLEQMDAASRCAVDALVDDGLLVWTDFNADLPHENVLTYFPDACQITGKGRLFLDHHTRRELKLLTEKRKSIIKQGGSWVLKILSAVAKLFGLPL